MLPMAYATMGLPVSEESSLTTKPKIGFSIDSIVGMNRRLVSPERRSSSPSPHIIEDDEDIPVSRKCNSRSSSVRTPSPHASCSSNVSVKSPIALSAGPVRPFPLPPKQMGFSTPSESAPANIQPPPHFLAAQFQMAAALAHGHHPPPGFPMTHHPTGFPVRDSYPLYPWLLSRHGRFFPHRFPGSKYNYG
uniref:Homeobox domain-containing protein n=1 Tax=Megaselia scalaris TaxID=36166 RepID=T1GAN8_MEGSC